MTRPTGKNNPTYRLTPETRRELAILATLDLWPKQHLADLFGVSRATVLKLKGTVKDE